jgi:hypothetical protein
VDTQESRMSFPLKILFDECLSHRVVQVMQDLLALGKESLEIMTLRDFMGKTGERDKDWIPAAAESGFLIITTDHGRKKRGDKLPELCQAWGVKHVLISRKLQQRGRLSCALAVLATWPGIGLARYEDGVIGYLLRLVDVRKGKEVGPHRAGLFRGTIGQKRNIEAPLAT